MKKICLLSFIFPWVLFAQELKNQVSILDDNQIEKLFPAKVKKELGVDYPIRKVYSYQDEQGKHFWVFTENKLYEITPKGDITYRKSTEGEIINDRLKAFHLLQGKDSFKIVRTLYDYRPKWEGWEFSIWFWTKFVSFSDLDGDGYVDPIIVYGAAPTDGDSDRGKVKLIAYYKNEKVGIRHQDAPDDDFRETQIDLSYYSLPKAVRQRIFDIINHLQENQLTTFDVADFKKLKR